ncbi:MAG: imidazoleglycerol-phosphate dehydratase HisB [Actinomycetota bacterium]
MSRTSRVERDTKETKVIVEVDLDGSGRSEIDTGIGMFDHLLTAFAHHSLIDVVISTTGDLHIDDHHTVEDTMLVLGSAVDEALGDREGIVRYGDARLPMDEAMSTAAVDMGGRPYAVIDVPFRADRIGQLSTQMVEHALEAFARTSRATINIVTTGRNDHHVAEATFKALARATRSAVELDPRRQGVPSTKGSL